MLTGFSMKHMNNLLRKTECFFDSSSLAESSMGRIASGVEFDALTGPQYPLLLAVLIDHEQRTAQPPNFYNIWALIATNNVDAALKEDPNWIELGKILRPEFLQKLLSDLGLWLAPFRLMSPAAAGAPPDTQNDASGDLSDDSDEYFSCEFFRGNSDECA